MASSSVLLGKASGFPSTLPVEESFISSLPRQWRDFQRSRPPRRIFLIGLGLRGVHHACHQVREDFAAGKAVVEVVLPDGHTWFYDFLGKVVLVLDAEGAVQYAIGFCWADDDGFVFTPFLPCGVDEEFVSGAFAEHGGGGRLALRAVRQCHHREARIDPFFARMEVPIFGWYGASAAGVEAAAEGDEISDNWQLIGAERAHGRGVHVSALDELILSADLSLEETNGASGSVLFCALVPGRREVIPAGSSQSQPSSSFFHTGIDAITHDTTKSKWYVFWKTPVRTRLLPLYKVSFVPTE